MAPSSVLYAALSISDYSYICMHNIHWSNKTIESNYPRSSQCCHFSASQLPIENSWHYHSMLRIITSLSFDYARVVWDASTQKIKWRRRRRRTKKKKKWNKHAILIDVHPIKNIRRVIESILRTSTIETDEESSVTQGKWNISLNINICNLQQQQQQLTICLIFRTNLHRWEHHRIIWYDILSK